jgi:hypothetical protein
LRWKAVAKKKSVDELAAGLLKSSGAAGLKQFRFGRESHLPKLMELSLDSLEIEEQPRLYFDESEIEKLAANIKEVGLLQPITVEIIDATFQRYRLVTGHRRVLAYRKLGYETIPALIFEKGKEISKHLVQLFENLYRADLHALEKANGVVLYVHSEIEKTGTAPDVGYITNVIRETIGKLAFRRALSEEEQAVADLLVKTGIAPGSIKNWFFATAFSVTVQGFFIENRVPIRLIRELVSFAGKPDDEVIALFKSHMETKPQGLTIKASPKRIALDLEKTDKHFDGLLDAIIKADLSHTTFRQPISELLSRLAEKIEQMQQKVEKRIRNNM